MGKGCGVLIPRRCSLVVLLHLGQHRAGRGHAVPIPGQVLLPVDVRSQEVGLVSRIGPIRSRHEPDQVDEEDRDDLALLAGRGHVAGRCAA